MSVLIFVVQAAVVFVVSATLFDILHYLLHRWRFSRFALLRTFSSWHRIHHVFLDREMRVHRQLVRANLIYHIIPEYLTSMAGTGVFLLVFPWPPVAAALAIRTAIMLNAVVKEGKDAHHMAMERIDGQLRRSWVDQSYHALHHVFPDQFYSSFLNLFDFFAGTTCQIAGRRFLLTGASGAYGSALAKRLKRMGATVETAKSGADFAPGDYARMTDRLAAADVLVLAHGAKTVDCWNANYRTFVDLIEIFRDGGKNRLTPPEVWAVGSEIELHGHFGIASLKDYSASKRAFAAKARDYYLSRDLIYRHIVPSAFTSAMGRGPMSADVAVAITLFLVRRGLTYVPVTLTTLAFWNYFRFRFWQPAPAAT